MGEYILGGKRNGITDGVQSFMHKATSEMRGAASGDSLPLTQQGARVTYLKTAYRWIQFLALSLS